VFEVDYLIYAKGFKNMALKLARLEQLHQSMAAQGIVRQRFGFQFRSLRFSVVYVAERFPHTLLLGCIAHNLYFVLDVDTNYSIPLYMGDNYDKLVAALELKYDPNNRFSPRVFFEELGEAIPTVAGSNNVPTITEVAKLSRDVDEADKVHFCGWRINDGISSNVSPENLGKTLRICGYAAHTVCASHNISSRWTDDASKAVEYFDPTP
jgi:hypothetical protein